MENTEAAEAPRPRNVLFAAPSYDGTVNVWHANALVETCKIGLANNINVMPLYMAYDALVQRARNDIFKIAYESGVDDLVFVDCDVDWSPLDFFRLLSHDVEIVGAAVPKKTDMEQYAVKITSEGMQIGEDGLIEVAALGTGFLRVRRDAIEKIWNYSEEYAEPALNKTNKLVFNVGILNGELCSEDVFFCESWRYHDGKIYLDPAINIAHTGVKRWIGNFMVGPN